MPDAPPLVTTAEGAYGAMLASFNEGDMVGALIFARMLLKEPEKGLSRFSARRVATTVEIEAESFRRLKPAWNERMVTGRTGDSLTR